MRAALGINGAVWVATALLLAGCCTVGQKPLLTTSGPGWRVQQGQALWRPGKTFPELGGDLVMADDTEGDTVLQFTKTPLPLVIAQTTRTNWYINFAPRHLSFAGRVPPPTRFAWLYLPVALSSGPLPSRFRFSRKPDGGWRLENTHSGETLEGFLAP
jgi:hypothetical protein